MLPTGKSQCPDLISAWRRLGLVVLGLSLLWFLPLLNLIRLAFRDDLYSHTLLVPIVSAYLIWINRQQLPGPGTPAWGTGLVIGAASIVCALWASLRAPEGAIDRLAVWILAYVLAVIASAGLILGRDLFHKCSFAFAFLLYFVPPPDSIVQASEIGLQYASAEVADWFFIGTRIPSIRNGLIFMLPGLTIEVAQECSGLRSSLVLLIVSSVAAYMFLRTPWKRFLLVFSVLPLGIIRNAFRIYTLAALSVYVDPQIIHSALHKEGGPIFFALSLVPLNLLLWILHCSDRSQTKATPPTSPL